MYFDAVSLYNSLITYFCFVIEIRDVTVNTDLPCYLNQNLLNSVKRLT